MDGSSPPTRCSDGTAGSSHDAGPDHTDDAADDNQHPTRSAISSFAWPKENPTWGYRRVTGELTRLGHPLAASTVWSILRSAGIAPSPSRVTVSWAALLKSQAAAACDFVTVDTALGRRIYLLFFIDVATRRVTFAGMTANPTGAWTAQAARNLFITGAARFENCKLLVRDRGGQFTETFDEIFRTEGIKIAKTPPRTPVANCFIERWFGTLRRELLDRTIIWNEPQLRRLIGEYVTHYNEHRPSLGDRNLSRLVA